VGSGAGVRLGRRLLALVACIVALVLLLPAAAWAQVEAPTCDATTATVNFDSSGNIITPVTAGGTPSSVSLVTNPANGTASISGTSFSYTPNTSYSGSDTFEYSATNAGGTCASPGTVSITVSPPTVAFTPTPPSPTVGVAYSQALTGSGGTAPYSFVVSVGALPAGLTLSSSGTISGTPTQAGRLVFDITVTDSSPAPGPYTGEQRVPWTVAAPTITLTPTTLPGGSVGAAYSQTVTATGGTATYSYAVTSGGLPAGLSLASNGKITGAPTTQGTYGFTITATDSSTGTGAPFTGSTAYNVTIAAPNVVVGPTTMAAATVGAAYNQAFTATGGTAPYTFALGDGSGPLPAGLTLSSTGALTGTPTAAGTFPIEVQATDNSPYPGPYSGFKAYTVTVNPPTITLAPATLPAASVGTTYSQAVTAQGGTATYTYAVTSGTLPVGLTLSTTGTLAGKPTVAGASNFTVTATDSSTGTGAPFTGSRAYAFTVNPPTITFAPANPAAGTVGKAYSQALTPATGGTAPYSYTLATGALPAGLALSSAGTIAGTPTAAGSFTFTVKATDSSTGTGAPFSATSGTLTLTVAAPTIVYAPASPPAGKVDTAYSQTLAAATGGTAPYSYALASGALPAGLTLSSAGTIAGTPTAAGSFTFTVKATDSSTGTGAPFSATSGTLTLTVAAPTIAYTPASPPAGTVGKAYSQTLAMATGGTAPYGYALASGALPAGLTLSSAGAIAGTPTAAGSFTFTVKATDSSTGTGAPFSATSGTLTLTVAAPTIVYAPASPPAGTVGKGYSQTLAAATGGTAPYSYALASGALPAGLALSSAGTIAGTPTVAGSFTFAVKATDSSTGTGAPFSATSGTLTLTVAAPTIVYAPASPPAGTVGKGYSQTLATATGGTAPYSYALASGALPAGLALSSAGTIAGTPTVAGSFTFAVKATDSSTGTGAPFSATSGTLTLAVGAPTISYNPASPPAGKIGTAYSQKLAAATGGTAPYSYALASGALPAGLAFATDGTISGTPTAAGSFTFTVKATDSSTGTGAPFSATSGTLTLTIGAPAITYAPASPPAGKVATAYSQSVTGATGGTAPYSYAIASGKLPAGLALATNGTIAGTPTAGGSFTFTVRATDSSTGTGAPFSATSGTLTLAISAPAIAVAPATLPAGQVGTAYAQSFTASGGIAPYTFRVTNGALPPGLALATGGALTGTPTTAATDNFTVTATDSSTGAGPYSGAKAYALRIGQPAAPVAAAKSVDVAYATATPINLSASITGVDITAVTVASGPSHGTTRVSGETVTYTPSSSFYGGTDSFTYTATNAGGTSQPATVSITVGKPPVPVAVADKAATPANQAVTIPVTANDTGIITSIAVAGAPPHGTAKVNGLNIAYTPAENFFGTDSFTYRDTGPGGTSAAATVTVTVTPLSVPTSGAVTATTTENTAVTIDVTANATGGPFTAVSVVTPPMHGTITTSAAHRGPSSAGHPRAASGALTLTYTPDTNFSGTDSFSFALSNAFGTSAPIPITITIKQLPTAKAFVITASPSGATVIDVTRGATGGPFNKVAIVTPPAPGTGTAIVRGLTIAYTPPPGFSGMTQISYTLSNANGTSPPAFIHINVQPRPDPSADPDLSAVLNAQLETARRFYQEQLSNFNSRLEDLHHGHGGFSFSGLKFQSAAPPAPGDATIDQPPGSESGRAGSSGWTDPISGSGYNRSTYARQVADAAGDSSTGDSSSSGGALSSDDGGSPGDSAPKAKKPAGPPPAEDEADELPDRWGGFINGTVDLGEKDPAYHHEGFGFNTDGISVGVDYRLTDWWVMGIGGGYSHDTDDIGTDGSRSIANGANVTLYGTMTPNDHLYFDGIISYGSLDFSSRRFAGYTGSYAYGSRDGEQLYGSLTGGYEMSDGPLTIAPYLRLNVANATLYGFTETGAGIASIKVGRQVMDDVSTVIGVHGDYAISLSDSILSPHFRIEYQHEFDGSSQTNLLYADQPMGPFYKFEADPVDRNYFTIGVGTSWLLEDALSFVVDYEALVGYHYEQSHTITFGVSKRF
jgi:uncharacterized protein YhjY with autotransporter beta-barrel domain